MNDLKELLERVKSATGPDREIDAAIVEAFGTKGPNGVPCCAGYIGIGSFTGSVDAMYRLIEAKLPGWYWRCGHATLDAGWANVYREHPNNTQPGDGEYFGKGAAPALALCAAFLSALSATEGEPT